MKKLTLSLIAVLFAVVTARATDSVTTQPESLANTPSPIAGSPTTDMKGVPDLVVKFKPTHYDIPPTYQRNIDIFGKYLAANPQSKATLNGYADPTGHGPANLELSQKRADAVAKYLIANYAISADRITATGYGEVTSKPQNSTGASRQLDRRVIGSISAS